MMSSMFFAMTKALAGVAASTGVTAATAAIPSAADRDTLSQFIGILLMVAGPRRAHRTPPALVVVASSYAAAWFPQRPRGGAIFPLPSRERRGPIAQQWGGEGVVATARLRKQPPQPPRLAGPPPLPRGERELLSSVCRNGLSGSHPFMRERSLAGSYGLSQTTRAL